MPNDLICVVNQKSTDFKTAALPDTTKGNAEQRAGNIYADKYLVVMVRVPYPITFFVIFFSQQCHGGGLITEVATMFYIMTASMSCFTIHNVTELRLRLAD